LDGEKNLGRTQAKSGASSPLANIHIVSKHGDNQKYLYKQINSKHNRKATKSQQKQQQKIKATI